MAIGTPVSIGTVQNKTNETTTVLTTAAAVPAGAMIVVVYAVAGQYVNTDGSIDSITDSAGNTYAYAAGGRSGSGGTNSAGAIYTALNATALAAGSSITLDWFGTGSAPAKAVSAFYVEGIATSAALDQSGVASGDSGTPSVSTAAATAQADELTVGIVATAGPAETAFTQDSSPAYATPPVRIGTTGGPVTSNCTVAGGYFIETATGVKTYNPTIGDLRWTAVIATFKAAYIPVSSSPPIAYEVNGGLSVSRQTALESPVLLAGGAVKAVESIFFLGHQLSVPVETISAISAARLESYEAHGRLLAAKQPALEAMVAIIKGLADAAEGPVGANKAIATQIEARAFIAAARNAAYAARLALSASTQELAEALRAIGSNAGDTAGEAIQYISPNRPVAAYVDATFTVAETSAIESVMAMFSGRKQSLEILVVAANAAQDAAAVSGLISSGRVASVEAVVAAAIAQQAVAVEALLRITVQPKTGRESLIRLVTAQAVQVVLSAAVAVGRTGRAELLAMLLTTSGDAAESIGSLARATVEAVEALEEYAESATSAAEALASAVSASLSGVEARASVARSALVTGESLSGVWRPALVAAEAVAGRVRAAPSSVEVRAGLYAAAVTWIEAAGLLRVPGHTSTDGTQALIAMSREAAEALVGASLAIAQATESPRGVFAPVPVSIWIDGSLYSATVVCESMPLGGGTVLVSGALSDAVLVRAKIQGIGATLIRPNGEGTCH